VTAEIPHRLKALCVFCGSQRGDDPAFAVAATRLGALLAQHGTALVYGGGRTGLMGALADAALAGGGTVIGVIPEFLKGWELGHADATEMVVVPDMHTRKRMMFERADAFCLLPGGIGSLDEFFEIVTWRQLHRHNKPVVVLNLNGYWQPLVALFQAIVTNGFAHAGHRDLVTVVETAEAVIDAVEGELAAPKTPLGFAAGNPFAPRP
jgi:uncharacterized protein (TIGR00730 family)